MTSLVITNSHVAEVFRPIKFLAIAYEENNKYSPSFALHVKAIIIWLTENIKDEDDMEPKVALVTSLTRILELSAVGKEDVQKLMDFGVAQVKFTKNQMQQYGKTNKLADFHDSLCGLLNVLIKKIDEDKFDEHFMSFYILVCDSCEMHKEAMKAATSFVNASQLKFEYYMPDFSNYFLKGLQNSMDSDMCLTTIKLVANRCPIMKEKMAAYSDGLVKILLDTITSIGGSEFREILAPAIVSLFGKIAKAIGDKFEKHILDVMVLLDMVGKECPSIARDEELLYFDEMKLSTLEAYGGILKGLKDSNPLLVMPYCQGLVILIKKCIKKQTTKVII